MLDSQKTQAGDLRNDLYRLIEKLPLESLNIMQQFAAFLSQQTSDTPTPSMEQKRTLEIVTVPASRLAGLIGLLSPGYEGNALDDTEALYDDI